MPDVFGQTRDVPRWLAGLLVLLWCGLVFACMVKILDWGL